MSGGTVETGGGVLRRDQATATAVAVTEDSPLSEAALRKTVDTWVRRGLQHLPFDLDEIRIGFDAYHARYEGVISTNGVKIEKVSSPRQRPWDVFCIWEGTETVSTEFDGLKPSLKLEGNGRTVTKTDPNPPVEDISVSQSVFAQEAMDRIGREFFGVLERENPFADR